MYTAQCLLTLNHTLTAERVVMQLRRYLKVDSIAPNSGQIDKGHFYTFL